jgi:hypothetical protein
MTPTIIDLKPGRWCAAALLVGETGRYLIQRRDGVRLDQFPGPLGLPRRHCRAGRVAGGGDPPRDLRGTGLSGAPGRVLPRVPTGDAVSRAEARALDFFTIPICEAEVPMFALNEGADLRLFST